MALGGCGGKSGTTETFPTYRSTPPATTSAPRPTDLVGLTAPSTADVSPAGALGPIGELRDNLSDRFVIDLELVRGGFPYKGTRALTPVSAAEVNLGDGYTDWPQGGSSASSYPKIYAPVDGIVHVVTPMVKVTKQTDRYGVSITVAGDGLVSWDLDLSMEPMVKEPADGFFAQFIAVRPGQRVHKGDVIAYLYVPTAESRLRFNLVNNTTQVAAAPAIFNATVVELFRDRWGGLGNDNVDGLTNPIPLCMGWRLGVGEDPFHEEQLTECLT